MPAIDNHNLPALVFLSICLAVVVLIAGFLMRRSKMRKKASTEKQFLAKACVPINKRKSDKPASAPLTGPFVLPQPPNPKRLKIEIHTLRYGNADWLVECAPTFDAWCARHSLPLYLRDTWDPSYPNSKFSVVDMLRDFLAGDSEWMMYVDADVVVHPQAPVPYFEESGFYVRPDGFNLNPKQREHWFEWCTEKFGTRPDDGWIYRNAGVWACDRASATELLAVIREPYHDGVMEQHQWNWWMHEACAAGMNAPFLPTEWNRFPSEMEPAWMFHIYAKIKFEHLRRFRKAGLLADVIPQAKFPLIEPPDFGKGAVVWPWKSSDAGQDALWYSSRSVLKHWAEKDWPLVLVGDQRPECWDGGFIHAESPGQALWLGTQCAGQVLWMSEDILMLADQTLSEFGKARHWGKKSDADIGKLLAAADPHRKQLGQVLMRLRHGGFPTRNHSSGIPQLYQREKIREVFDRFGITNKLPFETAYHNFHRTPSVPCAEKAKDPGDIAGKLWLNAPARKMSPEFRRELSARFGGPVDA